MKPKSDASRTKRPAVMLVAVLAVWVVGIALAATGTLEKIDPSDWFKGDRSTVAASSSAETKATTVPVMTTTLAPATTEEQTFSQAEIAAQSAESAYITTLSRAGINYDRSTLIELGKTACESLTIATDQGLSKSAAKLGLAQQYASGGSITQKEAIAIVSSAAGTFCPEHKGGY